MEIELLLPNRNPIPAQVELTDGLLVVTNDEKKITLALRGELWRLYQPQPTQQQLTTTKPLPQTDTWNWLTPEFVIQYFKQSPHLTSMASDVRAVLEPLCEQSPVSLSGGQTYEDVQQLLPLANQLIDEHGNPRYGAKTRAARELGGQPAGSFYYNRVLPALEQLSSISTRKSDTNRGKNEQHVA